MPITDLLSNFELPWFPSSKIFEGEECFEAPHPQSTDEGGLLLYKISYDTYAEWTAEFEGTVLYKGCNLIKALITCEEDAKEPI